MQYKPLSFMPKIFSTVEDIAVSPFPTKYVSKEKKSLETARIAPVSIKV
jgi:hypothetical protein